MPVQRDAKCAEGTRPEPESVRMTGRLSMRLRAHIATGPILPNESDPSGTAVSVSVEVACLVQLVRLAGGTNASAGNGRDILHVANRKPVCVSAEAAPSSRCRGVIWRCKAPAYSQGVSETKTDLSEKEAGLSECSPSLNHPMSPVHKQSKI